MTLTWAIRKGGSGKTTGALAVAAWLAQRFRVLVVDLDPDAFATTMGLGQSVHPDPLAASAIPIPHRDSKVGHLMLLPGGEAIDRASQSDIEAHIQRASNLADIVVVDTPPDGRRPTVLGALVKATVTIVPVIPDYQSLAGLEKLLQTSASLGLSTPVKALRSRWEPRTLLAQDVEHDLVTTRPGMALTTFVPKDQRAAESPAAGVPLPMYAKQSAASLAYRLAAIEISAIAGQPIPRGVI